MLLSTVFRPGIQLPPPRSTSKQRPPARSLTASNANGGRYDWVGNDGLLTPEYEVGICEYPLYCYQENSEGSWGSQSSQQSSTQEGKTNVINHFVLLYCFDQYVSTFVSTSVALAGVSSCVLIPNIIVMYLVARLNALRFISPCDL